jgi:hypothetical protein
LGAVKEEAMRDRVVALIILSIPIALIGWSHDHAGAQQKQTDAEISKLLIGKWAAEEPKIKGVNHYKKDGTLDVTGTLTLGDQSLKIVISATWKVSDGMIIATVTKTNVPELIKEGHVSKDQVISIDEKLLKFKTERGDEKVRKRVRE